MSVELTLYLINFIGNVTLFLAVTAFVCLLASFLPFCEDEFDANAAKFHKRFLIISLVLFGILCFLPSSKTMYMMVGSRYLKDSTIPAKVHDLIDKKLKELMEDGK